MCVKWWVRNLIENLGHQSQSCTMQSVFSGPVYVVKDNIDTDQIIPAQYLNLVPTIPEEYKKLLDQARRFSASDFARHNMPGTSYPGIDFPAARQAISLVERVVLVADSDAEREYQKVTANTLPGEVVKTEFGKSRKNVVPASQEPS